jgi:NhaP-type Na+/H+ or K+/H+ antiporter
MNDPVGAVLAVLVFESILAGGFTEVTIVMTGGILKTLILGTLLGILGASALVWMLRLRLLPDYLSNPATLMMVFLVFAISNLAQSESGLLAVTVMGIVLANQKKVSLQHIIEFKENLRVLLISVLFIILAARLQFTDLQLLETKSFIFLGILIILVRPLAVWGSTFRSVISWKERLFLSWMAPRGVVAAAVASLFSLELVNLGTLHAEKLVSLIFLVIIGTISVYGLTAAPLARKLGIASPNPQGCLIIGAHAAGITIGKILQQQGYPVLLVDTNQRNLENARLQGLSIHQGSILSENILDDLDLSGIGRLLALTANTEVNSLAALYFSKLFGTSEVYQLAIESNKEKSSKTVSKQLRGRILFNHSFNFEFMLKKLNNESAVKIIQVTKNFTESDLQNQFDHGQLIPLFLINYNKKLTIYAEGNQPEPKSGDMLIYLPKVQVENFK